ncbi:hypothetical protein B9Z55_005305 [Caenorhabditis nigoni]|uniref:Uncharacterized protein n=1 Tax=Caenorhabditis nigoni TaxID=1611254 RepID=A0A2G5V0B0_9PELO|nr:hypothetical protein B9Z55_005305 [Caenorhabditis nigoni]
MNRFILASFLLVTIFHVSLAYLSQRKVKNGDQFELDSFKNVTAISRAVPAGVQVFHFEGEHQGSFVDKNGKKIESSNYEIQKSILVIKKFTEADVGFYSKHPKTNIIKKDENGTIYAIPAPALHIILESNIDSPI